MRRKGAAVERLKKAEKRLARLEKGLLVALLSVMVTLSFLQVLLRQFLGTGILWGDTLLRHLVLWVGFLGAALAASEGRHFAWEAAAHQENSKPAVYKKGRALMQLTAHLATVLVTALLVGASWTFLKDERAAGDILFRAGSLAVPAWIFSAIIPVGFSLVLAHTLVKTAQAAAAIKS